MELVDLLVEPFGQVTADLRFDLNVL